MPPIIMNDCGSGGVSSGSPGDNKRRVGTGMCDIRKTSFITVLKREDFSDEMRGWYEVITVQGCNNKDRQWIHYSVAFGRMPNGSIQYLLLLS